MIFVPSVSDDITRYYRGTYVKFHETGDKLFYINSVDPREVTGTDEDGTEFQLFMKEDVPYNVDYILPRKSYFQYGKCATLLQRIPAKQYQRGLSGHNTKITGLEDGGAWVPYDIGFDVLKAYVDKQKFASLNEAVGNKEKKYSYALSSRMAYACRSKQIYLDECVIAQVLLSKEEKKIVMSRPIFTQEVKQLASGSMFEGKVV